MSTLPEVSHTFLLTCLRRYIARFPSGSKELWILVVVLLRMHVWERECSAVSCRRNIDEMRNSGAKEVVLGAFRRAYPCPLYLTSPSATTGWQQADSKLAMRYSRMHCVHLNVLDIQLSSNSKASTTSRLYSLWTSSSQLENAS